MTTGTRDRERVERAVFRRMARELRQAVRSATDEELLQAIEATTPAESIAAVLQHAGVLAGRFGDWGEELLRAIRHKQELAAAAGGVYSTGQVAELLGISVPAVQQRLRRKTLLAVPLARGEWGFPVVQFTERGVAPGFPQVLRAFGELDPWVQLSVLLSDDYGDGRVIDWIREGRNVEDAERIAGSWGVQGAA